MRGIWWQGQSLGTLSKIKYKWAPYRTIRKNEVGRKSDGIGVLGGILGAYAEQCAGHGSVN